MTDYTWKQTAIETYRIGILVGIVSAALVGGLQVESIPLAIYGAGLMVLVTTITIPIMFLGSKLKQAALATIPVDVGNHTSTGFGVMMGVVAIFSANDAYHTFSAVIDNGETSLMLADELVALVVFVALAVFSTGAFYFHVIADRAPDAGGDRP